MKKFDMTKVHSPEYYMDEKGKDVRIAMSKVNDFIQTLGDAGFSLIYANEDEHKTEDKHELRIIRRFHLRHAILDLNNLFDLFGQIIWFLHRYWDDYNPSGKFNGYEGRFNEIIRNTDEWIDKASKQCSLNKVIKSSLDSSIPELIDIAGLNGTSLL